MKTLATQNLAANILCVRHNSTFADVDNAAIRLFKFINEIRLELSTKTLSRRDKCYVVSGDDLEIWATTALLGLFYSQPKNTTLADYAVNQPAIEEIIRTAHLPRMCGIYLNARLGVPRPHHEHEITVGTITLKPEMRLIGLAIDMGGVSFDFLLDPLGINTLGDMDEKLYRPAHLMFENKTRAHVIFLSWSADHNENGVVYTWNVSRKEAARLARRSTT